MTEPRFTKMTAAHVDRLRELVGAEFVHVDSDALQAYSHDETEDLSFPPECVVKPASAEEVAAILTYASSERIAVTPRGGGTGLSGGCLPLHGGIALSLERMNHIVEIDADNLVCVTQPGVIVQTLQETVEEAGLFYPVDPASRGSCLIGGNIAENSGGPRAVKYGVTKDFVLGLTAVLASGEIIKTGGKLYKDVTGYNLTQTIVGSEGTLAVVTEIILKLLPLPKARTLLMIPFPDLDSAARTVAQIKRSGAQPSALEFMERDAIRAAADHLNKTVEYADAAAQLLIEIDGDDQERIDAQAEQIGELALANDALDVLLAEGRARQDELWTIRRSMGEAVKHRSIY
ncbi:MAG TPA: FAD-binding oxidoreductase, partial [candidate division Zixibacteria bacterium]|nr:FAD-binding oxidoreductase [candidate division Zixibacteria bacterium]